MTYPHPRDLFREGETHLSPASEFWITDFMLVWTDPLVQARLPIYPHWQAVRQGFVTWLAEEDRFFRIQFQGIQSAYLFELNRIQPTLSTRGQPLPFQSTEYWTELDRTPDTIDDLTDLVFFHDLVESWKTNLVSALVAAAL